jgi:hypothetical protein
LYEDAIVLHGWTARGRYRRRIPVEDIVRVKWWGGSGRGDLNYVLHLTDGRRVILEIRRSSGRFHLALQKLRDACPWQRGPLPRPTGTTYRGDGMDGASRPPKADDVLPEVSRRSPDDDRP